MTVKFNGIDVYPVLNPQPTHHLVACRLKQSKSFFLQDGVILVIPTRPPNFVTLAYLVAAHQPILLAKLRT
jgi:hypothetical protein